MTARPSGTTLEAYLSGFSVETRKTLERLRSQIRAAAPQATEGVAYGIGVFRHRGMLVGLGATKNHCALYLMSTTVLASHAADLATYELGKGTVRFPIGGGLPDALVKRLVKARIAENEAKR